MEIDDYMNKTNTMDKKKIQKKVNKTLNLIQARNVYENQNKKRLDQNQAYISMVSGGKHIQNIYNANTNSNSDKEEIDK